MTMEGSPAIVHGMAPKVSKGDLHSRPGADMPQRFKSSGAADGTGFCQIDLDGPKEGFYWMIGRLILDAPAGTCEVYVGDPADVLNLADYASSATKAIADESTPIYVPSGTKVSFVFRGVGANANCKVGGQYENKVAE